MTRRFIAFFEIMLLGLFLLAPSAMALTVDTNSSITLDNGRISTWDDPEGPVSSGSILSNVTHSALADSAWSSPGYAKAAANSDGKTAVAIDALGATGGDWTLSAISHTFDTITVSGSTAYTYDFSVDGPLLEIFDWCYGPSMMAGYTMEILVNGSSEWSSWATLQGGNDPGYTLIQGGTDLGATQFSGSGYGYTFGNYSETLNLGTMTADFTIETIIAVATSFPGYECGARALIGDPGNLNNSPGFTGILQTGGPAPVPEPGTILLFGIGLLGLAGVAQKK